VADARQFAIELSRFTRDKVPAAMVEFQRRIVAELLTAIVLRTPVGNHTRWKANIERAARGLAPLPKGYVGGQARRNWQVSIGSPATSRIQGTDSSGTDTINDGIVVLGSLTAPGRVWISNPLEYMEPLENGWSKQAPQGMVAKALADIEAKYSRPQP